MKCLIFLDNPASFNDPTAFITHVGQPEGKIELLAQLAEYLKFPWYFGHNWDALEECLCDFHWIDQFKIILAHDNIPQLKIEDFRIYIKILLYAINSWKDGEDHELKVVFPSEYENLIHPYEEKYLKVVEKSIKNGYW